MKSVVASVRIITMLVIASTMMVRAEVLVTLPAITKASASFTEACPTWVNIGNIVVWETTNTNFLANQAAKTYTLQAPTGFEFNTGGSHSITKLNGKDVNPISLAVSGTTITVTLTTDNNANQIDKFTIKNVEMRPTTATAAGSPYTIDYDNTPGTEGSWSVDNGENHGDLTVVAAATISSSVTGDWTSAASWVGPVVPGRCDCATIKDGHVITIDADISVGDVIIEADGGSGGGTLTHGINNQLDVYGDYTNNGSHDGGNLSSTLNFYGTGTIDGSGITSLGMAGAQAILFHDDYSVAASADITFGKQIDINGAGVTITNNGTCTMDASNHITGAGTWVNASGSVLRLGGNMTAILTASAATNLVEYNKSFAVQTIVSTTYSNLTISGAAGTKTLAGDIIVNNDITLTGTTPILATSTYHIELLGDWINTGATFTHNSTCILSLTGTGAQSITANAQPFYEIHVNKTAGTVNAIGDVTVANEFELEAGNAGTYLMDGETTTVKNLVTIVSGTLQITSGLLFLDDDIDNNWNQSGGTVDLDGGEIRVGNYTFNHSNADMNITGGTLDISGGTVNVTDILTMSAGALTLSAGTVNVKTGSDAGTGDAGAKLNITGGALTMTGGDIVLQGAFGETSANPAMDLGAAATVSLTGGTITAGQTGSNDTSYYVRTNGHALYNFTVNHSGDTVFLFDDMDINGNLNIIAGILNVTEGGGAGTEENILLAGNWDNSGDFMEGTARVTMDGTLDQDITNASGETFYELFMKKSVSGDLTASDDVTATQELQLEATNIGTYLMNGETTTSNVLVSILGGTINLTAGLLYMNSDVDGNWTHSKGTLDVDGGEVRIGNYGGGTHNDADMIVSGTGVVDISAGTINVTDRIDMTGTSFTMSGGAINIASSTNAGAGDVDAKLDMDGGSFTMSGGTINVKGAYDNAAGNPAVDLNNTVSITAGTIVLTGTGSDDESYYFRSNGNAVFNLTLNNTGESLYLYDDIEINGNLVITAGILNATEGGGAGTEENILLAGNWTNTGDFVEGTARVTMDGTGSQNITNASGETYYELFVDKSAGTLTSSNDITATQEIELPGTNAGLFLMDGETVTSNNLVTITGGTVQLTGGVLYMNADVDGNWNQSGGTLDIDAGEVRVGNYSGGTHNDADMIITGGAVDFSGGTLNITDRLDVSGTGTFTMSGGDLTVAASTNAGAGDADSKLDFDGGSFTFSGGIINVKGAYDNAAGNPAVDLNNTVSITAGTIVLTGTGSDDESYYFRSNGNAVFNLTLNNTGESLFLYDDMDINGDLLITAGTLNATEGGGTGTEENINLAGDWNNAGTYTMGTATVTFDGSIVQNMDNTGGEDFYGLTMNNSSGVTTGLFLNDIATVNGALTLTDGYITTTTTNLLVVADNATATSGSNASHVDGPMKKIGDDAFVFPIGDGLNDGWIAPRWARLGISALANFDVTTEIQVMYIANRHGDNDVTAPLNDVSLGEYWIFDMVVDPSSDGQAKITLHWEDATRSGVDAYSSDLRVASFNTGTTSWEDEGQGSITGSDPGDVTSNLLAAANMTRWFAFGSQSPAANPLPITLLSFDAILNSNKVDIEWITVSEINNDYFTIEKSRDGITFTELKEVPGAGNSNKNITYTDVDDAPYQGLSYYRLKQTDYDGQFTYSHIVAVNYEPLAPLEQTDASMSLYPNPSAGQDVNVVLKNFKSTEPILVVVMDNNGREFYSKVLVTNKQGDAFIVIDTGNVLAAGMYLVVGSTNNSLTSEMLIITR